MSTWQITKITSKWRHAWSPPKATDNSVIVVFEGHTCRGLLGQQTSLNATACRKGHYRFHFVPLSMRTINESTHVLAQETGLKFKVDVEVNYRVADAVAIAKADPPDLDAQVKARVRGLLHEYDGKYAVKTWSSLQDAIRQHLYRTSSNWEVKVENLVIKVQPDKILTEKAIVIFDKTEQLDVEKATHDLDMLKQEHEQQLLAKKVEFYAEMLNKGRFHQLALSITDDNDMVREVVTHFRQERNQTTKRLWDTFEYWLKSDDAQLISNRVNDILKVIGAATSLLGGNNVPVLPSPEPSKSAPNVLIEPSDGEDWKELIETIREEQMDEPEADDRRPKKKRDPEDDFL